jgi:hypothetical protein
MTLAKIVKIAVGKRFLRALLKKLWTLNLWLFSGGLGDLRERISSPHRLSG